MADFGDAYSDLANTANSQRYDALSYGERAAQLADPVAQRRKKYMDAVDLLTSNPGSQETNPLFQYIKKTRIDAAKSVNAAKGRVNSGRGALALGDAAQEAATSAYFPLLAQYAKLAGYDSSSPTAAALTYERSTGRAQDYQSIQAAAKAAGKSAPPSNVPQPWWDNPNLARPTGGGGGSPMPYSYASGGPGYVDSTTPGYMPSQYAGSGYVMSDGGATAFNPGSAPTYYASTPQYSTPSFGGGSSAGGDSNAGGDGYSPTDTYDPSLSYTPEYNYDPNAYADSGGYSDTGYSDFGGGDYYEA